MKHRILFVDDEKNILDGIRRMLWQMRAAWDMTFARSGAEALDVMAQGPFDVVVTDMRMPHMDGAALLTAIKEKHPAAVRIILSGFAEREMTLKSLGVAHQYIAKPCDFDSFERVLGKCRTIWKIIEDSDLKETLSRIDALPSDPEACSRLTAMLDQPEVRAQDIGRVIAADLGMSAKILQLVHSAFFGLPKRFTDISEAVVYLGAKTFRSMSAVDGLFSAFDPNGNPGFRPKALFRHSRRVGIIAKHICLSENMGTQMAENAFLAGLLHDVGKLVIAACFPKIYHRDDPPARRQERHLCQPEMEALGAGHAAIGAYLMGLWGLPEAVVEAIARHHSPSDRSSAQPTLAGLVHAADIIAHQEDGDPPPEAGSM